jgi:hypothetical protein
MTALSDLQLKLDRAENHLDGLSKEIQDVAENHSVTIGAQHNELDNTDTAIITNVPEVRREWGVMLGDFLHNTRSALDHLVSALVVVSGGTVTNRHQFPICDTLQQWQSRVAQASQAQNWLGSVDPSHVAVIETLQPYQPTTGLKSLATLARFSNADKHRLIHGTVINITQEPQLSGILAVPLEITQVNYLALTPGSALQDGAPLARYRARPVVGINPAGEMVSPGADVRIAVRVNLTTAFGEPGNEDTRIRDFRECLTDAMAIVGRFASVL